MSESSTCCPMCEADGMFMGHLGSNAAFRCWDCGWDWTVAGFYDPDEEDDECESEWDGQPDEAQEWHDFDPDC